MPCAWQIGQPHLGPAVDQRILHLIGHDADAVLDDDLQMLGIEVGQGQVTDFAFVAQLGQVASGPPGIWHRRNPTSGTAAGRGCRCPSAAGDPMFSSTICRVIRPGSGTHLVKACICASAAAPRSAASRRGTRR